MGTPVVDALEAYYQALISPDHSWRRIRGRSYVPDSRPPAPGVRGNRPFVGRSGLNGTQALLGVTAHSPPTVAKARPTSLASSTSGPTRHRLAATTGERGSLYVPASCTAAPTAACRLQHHVPRLRARRIIRRSTSSCSARGFLEVGETNHVVLLFRRMEPTSSRYDPNGCWDSSGYEGRAYAARAGPQVRAVRSMITDLLGEQALALIGLHATAACRRARSGGARP